MKKQINLNFGLGEEFAPWEIDGGVDDPLMPLNSSAGIASRVHAWCERMIQHFDEAEESLEHLRGRIGVLIGSKTPPEIAVSIMAEVIAVRNAIKLPRNASVGAAKTWLEVSSA